VERTEARGTGLDRFFQGVGIKEADVNQMAKQCYEIELMVIKMWNPRDAGEADVTRIYNSAF
jgi:alcohol dehydrogenase class IV